MSEGRSERIVAVLPRMGFFAGILSLSAAMVVASAFPGDGSYEASIYQAYPTFFWILIGFALVMGVFSALSSVFIYRDSYAWVFGFMLIVASNCLVLSLPLLRDYAFMGMWDSANHYSYTLNIVEYGRPHPENFYPMSHLLAAMFHMLTGIELHAIILIFPLFFYLLYMANTLFLAWTIDNRPGVRALIMVLASLLVYSFFGVMFYPTHFAVYMMPLFLGWLLRSRLGNTGTLDSLPILLILFFLPFLHPWAVISTVVVTATFILSAWWRQLRTGSMSTILSKPSIFLTPLLIVSVTWLAWFTTFQLFGASVQRILHSFRVGLGGPEALSRYLEVAQRAGLSVERVVSLILHTYGPSLLYLGMASTVIGWVWFRAAHYTSKAPLHLLALSIFVLVFVGLSVVSLFRDLISGSPLRFLNFAVGIVPVLVSGLFYEFMSRPRSDKFGMRIGHLAGPILMIVLVVALVLGMLGSYPSSYTGQANNQISHSQRAGIEFLVEKAPTQTRNIYTPLGLSFLTASVASAQDLTRIREGSPGWWIRGAPAHFGYRPGPLGVEEFDNPGYLLITAYEKAYYTEVWPEKGQFTDKDFAELNNDPSWNLVYTSGDLMILQNRVRR